MLTVCFATEPALSASRPLFHIFTHSLCAAPGSVKIPIHSLTFINPQSTLPSLHIHNTHTPQPNLRD